MPPVIFETARLVVRHATRVDVDALLTIYGVAENIGEYGAGRPWTRAEVEQFITYYPLVDERWVSSPGLALLKPQMEVVGYGGVGYYVADGYTANLLFLFKRAVWGRGLATELARAAIATAFEQPAVEVIHATVKPTNQASIRVLEKCGMHRGEYVPEDDRLRFAISRAAYATASTRPV